MWNNASDLLYGWLAIGSIALVALGLWLGRDALLVLLGIPWIVVAIVELGHRLGGRQQRHQGLGSLLDSRSPGPSRRFCPPRSQPVRSESPDCSMVPHCLADSRCSCNGHNPTCLEANGVH